MPLRSDGTKRIEQRHGNTGGATGGVTGAMRAMPTGALGAVVNVKPLDLTITAATAMTVHRFRSQGELTQGRMHTPFPEELSSLSVLSMRSNAMIPGYTFGRRYGTLIPSRHGGKTISQIRWLKDR